MGHDLLDVGRMIYRILPINLMNDESPNSLVDVIIQNKIWMVYPPTPSGCARGKCGKSLKPKQ